MTEILTLAGDLVTVVAALVGAAFFTAGTIGLLRFGDLRSRLHALAKADGLGLGLVVLALLPQVDSLGAAAKLVLLWVLALAMATTSAFLLATDHPGPSASAATSDRSGPSDAGTESSGSAEQR